MNKKKIGKDQGEPTKHAAPESPSVNDNPAVLPPQAPEVYSKLRRAIFDLQQQSRGEVDMEAQVGADIRRRLKGDGKRKNPNSREALRHAIAKEMFEGDSSPQQKINRHLDAVRSKIEAPDPTEFWVTRVMPLLQKAYPKLLPKEVTHGKSVLDNWNMAAQVLVVMAERAIAELGKENWTPPLPKKRIRGALRLYNRNWTRWRKKHAAALRAPRGSVDPAKHLSVNLSSPLIPRAERVLLASMLERQIDEA